MRIHAFDYFRGVAILMVIAWHCHIVWALNSFLERVVGNLLAGATTLFVFISGFLFHHVFYEHFDYKAFMIKKTKYVLLPYVFLSIAGIVYYLLSQQPLPYAKDLNIQPSSGWLENINIFLTYLWTGRIVVAYWFIPFIYLVFLLSPVFIRFIRLNITVQLAIIIPALCLAMLVHRPTSGINPLHSFIYFIPVYLIGIVSSINRQRLIELIEKKVLVLGVLVVSLSLLQAYIYPGYGNLHKENIFSYNGIDIMIIQKICMCFLFVAVLHKFEERKIPALKTLASTSFALYFIHPWVLHGLEISSLYQYLNFLPGPVMFTLVTMLTLTLSIAIAMLTKTTLKNRSRILIGW